MQNNRSLNLIAASACLALISAPVAARKASTLTDLNGSRAAGAETELQSRGFSFASSNKNKYGAAYSYWWHAADKNCVSVEVMDGKVMTINDASDGDCGHNSNGTAAAVGVVAGAALLGALLSHKSNHHENGQHLSDAQAEAQYDRGYNDGLYNAAYHNYDRSDAYSSGYQAGVDQRTANLSHHHNRGGYAQVAQYQDLRDSRAAGAMDELTRRGFVQVDNFASGDTRYSIQWRAASRQCLQVTVADGRIYSIDDIQTHPKCR